MEIGDRKKPVWTSDMRPTLPWTQEQDEILGTLGEQIFYVVTGNYEQKGFIGAAMEVDMDDYDAIRSAFGEIERLTERVRALEALKERKS